MGWQSYVLPFETESERKRILKACVEHNTMIPERWDEVGEELHMVQQVNVLRPYKKMYDGPTTKQVILCGNGGGRSSTFKWFEDRNITVYPYTSAMGSRFSRRNMVAIGLLNYANSTLITEEEEKKEETD